MLHDAIQAMYREIADCGGNFGDPIDTGPDNHFERLREGLLSLSEVEGLGVAVLCFLSTAIDNSTYEAAVRQFGEQVQRLLADRLLDAVLVVRAATEAFLVSEVAFIEALADVYRQVVLVSLAPDVAG